ncbi:MAG: hypothetical protein L3J28_12090 [Candidatus Polarisedimenticolaceae bacterium]|nr:hypothetical protein [Candidatus Polarisedimenticolaceae bacterium]
MPKTEKIHLKVVLLAFLFISQSVDCSTTDETKKPMKITYETSPMDSLDLSPTLTPLKFSSQTAKNSVPSSKDFSGNYFSPYGNAQQNSRTVSINPSHNWHLVWKTEIIEKRTPRFVLQKGGAIAIQATAWQLFSIDGKATYHGIAGPGQLSIDTANHLLYSIDRNGYLTGTRHSDGVRAFRTSLSGGDLAGFPWVHRQGEYLLAAGSEFPKSDFESNAPSSPTISSIDSIYLINQFQVISTGGLLNGILKRLMFETETLHVAANNEGDKLWVTVPNRLLITNHDLEILNGFSGDFTPLSMSLDEANTAYIIVKTDQSRELWRITSEGVVTYRNILMGQPRRFEKPPAVGIDHTAYIASDDVIQAIDINGQTRWSRPISDTFAGMSISASNKLLISEESSVILIDEAGQSTNLFDTGDEPLTTPPILTENGDILVASGQYLYRLTANKTTPDAQ